MSRLPMHFRTSEPSLVWSPPPRSRLFAEACHALTYVCARERLEVSLTALAAASSSRPRKRRGRDRVALRWEGRVYQTQGGSDSSHESFSRMQRMFESSTYGAVRVIYLHCSAYRTCTSGLPSMSRTRRP